MKRKFEWDEDKNESNEMKHFISFENAVSVFDDPNAVYIYDEEHSVSDERFVIIGRNKWLKILSVCHCYRDNNNVIRLISAREATKRENVIYRGTL